MRQIVLLLVPLLIVAGSVVSGQEILTNESVIDLLELGFSEEVVVGKVKASPNQFDVSLEALKKLKESGVPDSVIAAMIEAANTEMALLPEPDPTDPLSPQPPGIYWWDEEAGELVKIEPSVYTQAKSGGFLKSAFTYGIAKVKSRAVLPGTTARLRVSSPQPVFYFYFEEIETGLSYQSQATTSPGEFILAEFKVKQKKGSRELVVGQMNAFGAQSGALDKTVRRFDYEEVAPGIYRVVPTHLARGEYCFYYAGQTALPTYGLVSGTGGRVFDFGVD